ncbi:DoxX family protein [Microbacterium sp. TWP3-1-2b2]|uniref:DoxX family protein n=1 Tax=Microbacterium sp. TWP3-1-2b2 TaxID=2804651 RepID=UPI003CF21A53
MTRRRKRADPRSRLSGVRHAARWALAAALALTGSGHLSWGRRGFRITVPDWATRVLRMDKDAIVVASGVVELLLAAALLMLPRERARVGWAVAAFFVAVLPGNVHQWRTRRSAPLLDTDGRRLGRLFLQPLLVVWALWSTAAPEGRRRG